MVLIRLSSLKSLKTTFESNVPSLCSFFNVHGGAAKFGLINLKLVVGDSSFFVLLLLFLSTLTQQSSLWVPTAFLAFQFKTKHLSGIVQRLLFLHIFTCILFEPF